MGALWDLCWRQKMSEGASGNSFGPPRGLPVSPQGLSKTFQGDPRRAAAPVYTDSEVLQELSPRLVLHTIYSVLRRWRKSMRMKIMHKPECLCTVLKIEANHYNLHNLQSNFFMNLMFFVLFFSNFLFFLWFYKQNLHFCTSAEKHRPYHIKWRLWSLSECSAGE